MSYTEAVMGPPPYKAETVDEEQLREIAELAAKLQERTLMETRKSVYKLMFGEILDEEDLARLEAFVQPYCKEAGIS